MHWIWTAASVATAGLLFTRARKKHSLYLTFDDGPHPEHTPRLLKVLSQHQIPATFFLIGERAEQYPEVVRQIVAAGHVIGNHSYSHPSFNVSSFCLQSRELERANEVLKRFDGRQRHLVRPPYGKMNWATIVLCMLRRERIALWNKDSYDYRLGCDEIVQRAATLNIALGDVLLFHDDGSPGIDALEILLPRWRSNGLRFSTL
jgi:peptidoglycan/xylan/chitin deacetylase (PgdA/CDA1 family)